MASFPELQSWSRVPGTLAMEEIMRSILIYAIALTVLASGSARAEPVGIATMNEGTLVYSIGAAVAEAAGREGLDAVVVPIASPPEFIRRVASGDPDFGVITLQNIKEAVTGEGAFAGAPMPNLRVVGLVMPLRFGLFVRADSAITSIADLKGQPMPDGFATQPSIQAQVEAQYAAGGLSREDIVPVEVLGLLAGPKAFSAGEVVGFPSAHGSAMVREAQAAVGDIRALPIDPTQENLARAHEHEPGLVFVKIAAGTAPGVSETGSYLAHQQVLFTHAGAPGDLVQAMARVLHDGKEILAESFPPFADFEPTEMLGDIAPAEYHSAALEYLNSEKPTTSE